MRIFWTIAGAILAFATASPAADKDPLLDHLAGYWVLTGTIAGQQTTHDIDAAWILQDTYLQFHEVSREKDAAGKPRYEAEVLLGYDAQKKRYVCFWYDITGVAGPDGGGVAMRNGDTLPFVFQTSDGPFHTTFAYDSKRDRWTWAMDMEAGGKLTPFARNVLARR